jgi:exopolysaccharide production protein ExoZ
VSGNTIAPLQALRGIAAAMVVLWHASRYLPSNGPGSIAQFLQPGAVMGVDLFFLISGFIMVHTTRDSDGSARYVAAFLVKRIARIWPLWAIALAAAIVLQMDAAFLSEPVKRIWFLRSLAFVPTPGVTADAAPVFGAPVLGVGWTLNYEMYFYAFFAVSMLFGKWRWAALFAWVVATVLLLPLFGGQLDGLRNWWDFFSCDRYYHYAIHYLNLVSSPLILLFVAGALIGLVYHARVPALRSRVLAAAFAGVAVLLVVLQFVFAFRPYHGVLHWGLSLIPLLLACALASRSIELPVPASLRYLGDISFSLYLWHTIVLGIVFAAFRGYGQSVGMMWVAVVLALAAALAVAAVSHRFIERGLSDALRRAAFARLKFLHPTGPIAPRLS